MSNSRQDTDDAIKLLGCCGGARALSVVLNVRGAVTASTYQWIYESAIHGPGLMWFPGTRELCDPE